MSGSRLAWWHDAVIYQVYPRSFQDTDGDGVGDLPGIIARLPHIQSLGASAIWLSPFYRSPNADFGYDVSAYTEIDPAFGTLADFDRLVEEAHARDLRVVVDFVPCHTSIEHPWFRERPDFYFWADEPPNNWLATFGGSAWQHDEATGRYYLHSFFPEQADLNWRNPDVRSAMADALRFWLARGVDGFRVDAIDRLLKDPNLRDDPPAAEPFALPLDAEYGRLRHVNSLNAPDIGDALGSLREAVGDAFLVGEAYLPTSELGPYLATLDVAFAFEPMNAGPDAERLRATITAALESGKIGWVLSNHDFPRFATRFGPHLHAALLLFLSLPGPAFMLHGDELGVGNGPGVEPPLDRADRDRFRHPMPWDETELGGFTTGTPWLPLARVPGQSVAAQERDPGSVLHLVRRLIRARSELGGQVEFMDSAPGSLVFRRGGHLVAANFGEAAADVPRGGQLLVEGRVGDGADPSRIPPGGAVIRRL